MNATDEKILELLAKEDGYVSGEAICTDLGMTRAAVWKHIKSLKAAGYTIESARGSGYRLTAAPNYPFPCEVRKYLTTRVLGQTIKYAPLAASTNSQMVEMGNQGAPHGMVLVADQQTGGRGRMTRSWFSPPGVNLYFSLLLRPDAPPVRAPQLSLVAGLAMARAIEAICPGLAPKVKWPNDVFLDGRKVSGILCDMRAETDRIHYLVVGVGINVNVRLMDFPADVKDRATSLYHATGQAISRAALLAAFLNRMEILYETWLADGLEAVLPELETRAYQKGRVVTVAVGGTPLTGTAVGFSPGGGLLVDCGERTPREVLCGDILPADPGEAATR